jgi:hypothetical protein
MVFANEVSFEKHIREIIALNITAKNPEVYALNYKTVGDIVICRDGIVPALYFLEIKYYQMSKGRLGFGNRAGEGIQPEILVRKPAYFESNLRWLIGSDTHGLDSYWLVKSNELRNYIAGGNIERKQNNIQEAIFRQTASLDQDGLIGELEKWLLLI